jgi:hypothetical protein
MVAAQRWLFVKVFSGEWKVVDGCLEESQRSMLESGVVGTWETSDGRGMVVENNTKESYTLRFRLHLIKTI